MYPRKHGRHPAQGDPGEINQIDMNIKNMTSVSVFAVVVLFCIGGTPLSSLAGRGYHDSAPIACDALPPSINILTPIGDEIIYGFDVFDMIWTTNENNPAPDNTARRVALYINNSEYIFSEFDDTNGQHTWPMDVPDISSGSCTLVVTVADAFGNQTSRVSETFTILLHDTGIDTTVPLRTRLNPARPNPFNPTTTLSFTLASAGHTTFTIHDLRGRAVRTLVDRNLTAGFWSTQWNGRDDLGRQLPAATYITRLTNTNHTSMTGKVVLLP